MLLQPSRWFLTAVNPLQDRKQPLKPANHLHRVIHRTERRVWLQVRIPALPWFN